MENVRVLYITKNDGRRRVWSAQIFRREIDAFLNQSSPAGGVLICIQGRVQIAASRHQIGQLTINVFSVL